MQAFRVKFPALWRQTFPALMLGAVVSRLLQWAEGKPFSWPDTLPLAACAAVGVLLVHYFQPARAGAAGLRVMNSWGFTRPLAWHDVRSAQLGRYLLQPSIKLVDARGRAYWIARDTHNLSGLHRLAAEFGGPAHPLTQVLQTPLHSL